jgi:hypothetical protein
MIEYNLCINTRKANCIRHNLRRNCLIKPTVKGKIEGRIEVTRRRGRKRKPLHDDLKEKRGYCKLVDEALDRTVCKTLLGKGYGPLVSQATWNYIFGKAGIRIGFLENQPGCDVILHCSLQMQDYMLSINCCLSLK